MLSNFFKNPTHSNETRQSNKFTFINYSLPAITSFTANILILEAHITS